MCPSRKRTTSIMNNGGFGEIVEIINGIPVIIPESYLLKNGKMKKYALRLLERLRANKIGVVEFYEKANLFC